MAYTTSPSCMHMAPLLQALISIGLLLASISMLMPGGSAEERPSGIVDANGGFTREQLFDSVVEEAMLPNGDGDGSTKEKNPYQYLVKVEMGRRLRSFFAVPDTGSDLVWTTKLERCNRRVSSSFVNENCSDHGSWVTCDECFLDLCMFNRRFGVGRKYARGFMGNDTLTLPATATTATPNKISFGCAVDTADNLFPRSADGVLGLNRGPMSLVQQLNLTNFSYCFSDQPEASGRLWLGNGYDLDELRAGPEGKRLNTTPLVDAEGTEAQVETGVFDPNRYYVQLEGISIGGDSRFKTLPKKRFNLKSKQDNKKGVMFVDSGTRLEKGVFGALVRLLAAELKAKWTPKKEENNLETACFQPTTSKQPEMVLYFADGANMSLPWANYTYTDKKQADESAFCLKIYNSTANVLGKFQQQNTYMLHNLTGGRGTLSFVQDFDCRQKPRK